MVKNSIKGMSPEQLLDYLRKIEDNPIPYDAYSQCDNCSHIWECNESNKKLNFNESGWLLCYLERN